MPELTDARRKELRELCEKATPGPLSSVDGTIFCECLDPERGHGVFILYDRHGYAGPECNKDADGKFFAAARTALPELLDEIGRLHDYAERLARECIHMTIDNDWTTEQTIAAAKAKLEANNV